MRNYWKLFGDPLKNNIELSCNFSRWLVGFGWIGHHPLRYKQRLSIHFNLGPLAIIITIL